MKQNEAKFGMWKLFPWARQGVMIRKGAQGGSAELLDPEAQRRIDTHCRRELERLGSDFPYDEFADRA